MYATALESLGKTAEAVDILDQVLKRHPTHRNTLYALIEFNSAAGEETKAALFAQRLRQLWPDDPRSRSL